MWSVMDFQSTRVANVAVKLPADIQATMAETEVDDTTAPSLLGRLLFGGGLIVLAVRNLTDLNGRIAYANAKGVPKADTLVPAASGLLLGGGLGITAWKLPKLSAGSVAAFFIGVTPLMHDFWAVDDDQRDDELTAFLQNLALLGAALAFLQRARDE
ncbi:putative membrane protein YphA (DoxX/SURF4 family) [Haloarcula quadrata]|uniref:Putative membrane protein YphA (DoxX/SURF4 family) n=2 Tax=Haloarcula quadrata TaxID=182779 RepID=A0A495QQN1_9EURY|nr:putative membrane protein YphA (DoxX/SURF4 family) [Haloarcula quadrata]